RPRGGASACDRSARGRTVRPARWRCAARSRPCRRWRRASRGLLRQAPLERDELALFHREAVVLVGEGPRADVAVIVADRLDHGCADVGVPLGELRLERAEEAEEIVEDEDLSVAVDPRADAD